MKKPTKLIISVLAVAFAVGILAGCGGTNEAGITPGSADPGTRTIIDSLTWGGDTCNGGKNRSLRNTPTHDHLFGAG